MAGNPVWRVVVGLRVVIGRAGVVFVAIVEVRGNGVVAVVVSGGGSVGMTEGSGWAGLGLYALSLEAVLWNHVEVRKGADIG